MSKIYIKSQCQVPKIEIAFWLHYFYNKPIYTFVLTATVQSLKHLISPLNNGTNYKFEEICTFILHQHLTLMNGCNKKKKWKKKVKYVVFLAAWSTWNCMVQISQCFLMINETHKPELKIILCDYLYILLWWLFPIFTLFCFHRLTYWDRYLQLWTGLLDYALRGYKIKSWKKNGAD